MASTDSRWQRVLDVAPLLAALGGAAAEKLLHRGVEAGILELLAVGGALLALEHAARPRLGLPGSRWRAPVAIGLVLLGVLAVFVYPLPRQLARGLLVFELGALVADWLEAHPPDDRLVRRASGASAILALIFAVAGHAVVAAGPPYFDSSLYLLNGRWLLEGVAPYRDSHLSKPPVLLVPNALFALAHDTRFLPQVASFISIVATGAILARSKALEGDPRRGLVFALAVALLSLEEYGQHGNLPETYATPSLALAWARLAAPAPRTRDLVVGGGALGVLVCTKQTHGLYAVSLFVALAFAERGRPGVVGRLALVVGSAIGAVALVVAPLAAVGLLGDLVRSTILYWLRMPPALHSNGTLIERLVSLAVPIAPFLLLAVAAVVRVVATWRRRPPERPALGFLALVAAGCVIQAIEQRAFRNPHYVLHLFIPLALAPWVLARTAPAREGPLARTLACALAVWALAPLGLQLAALPRMLADARARLAMTAKAVPPVDRTPPETSVPLLVLGGLPDVYLHSARRCVNPQLFTGLSLAQEVVKDAEGPARVRAVLRTRPLVVLVVEPSQEFEVLDVLAPWWRAELDDCERERVDEGLTIFRRRAAR